MPVVTTPERRKGDAGRVVGQREIRACVTVYHPSGWPHRPVQSYETFGHTHDRALYSSYVRLLFLGVMPDWERRGAIRIAGEWITYWDPKLYR